MSDSTSSPSPSAAWPLFPEGRSIWLRGGAGAPARARRHLRSQLDNGIPVPVLLAEDAALVVSELVTNSVIHAGVGIDQQLCLELLTHDGQLQIAVIDGGSELEPCLVAPNPATPGGLGLRVVDEMSSAWGVARNPSGRTRVWCDLPLQPHQASEPHAAGNGGLR